MPQSSIVSDQLHSLSWPQDNLFQMETPWRLLCHVIPSTVILGQVLREGGKNKINKTSTATYSISARWNMCGMRERVFIVGMYHWIMCRECSRHRPRYRFNPPAQALNNLSFCSDKCVAHWIYCTDMLTVLVCTIQTLNIYNIIKDS